MDAATCSSDESQRVYGFSDHLLLSQMALNSVWIVDLIRTTPPFGALIAMSGKDLQVNFVNRLRAFV
jgi:hypothetical protein